MSWDQYLTGFLTQKADMSGMLCAAGIFSQAGAKCAAAGDEVSFIKFNFLLANSR